MNPLLLGTLFDFGGKLIDRLFPDPEKKAAAVLDLEKMRQTGELAQLAADTELAKGQQAINLKEAEHPEIFVSGWRPFIGWVCGVSLAVYFIPRFLVSTIFWSMQVYSLWNSGQYTTVPPMPDVGISDILGLTATLLGMAGLRSWEKNQGVARDGIRLREE